MKKRFIKPDEVAVRYGRSSRTIREWITNGCRSGASIVTLPAMKAGKGWLIAEEDLEIFDLRLKRATTSLALD